MSCLPAVPLSDLATEQHLEAVLSAKFSAFELKMAAKLEAVRKEAATQREADREAQVAQREADRKEAAAQREADRKTLDQRLRRLAIALPIEIVVALAAVVAVTEWLRG